MYLLWADHDPPTLKITAQDDPGPLLSPYGVMETGWREPDGTRSYWWSNRLFLSNIFGAATLKMGSFHSRKLHILIDMVELKF